METKQPTSPNPAEINQAAQQTPQFSNEQVTANTPKPTNSKSILGHGIVVLVLLLFVGIGGYLLGQRSGRQSVSILDNIVEESDIAPGDSDQVVCTMDAKECPDGSFVGRVGPNCEFTECSTEQNEEESETYENKQYGFSFQYPEKYEIVEDKSGWPKAVAILYDGGQSYNLIVEVAESAVEYQNLNVTMGSNIGRTEVKSKDDLFVVLRNNNGEPEVDQVIATFKFNK
jgi:hypothetical protein